MKHPAKILFAINDLHVGGAQKLVADVLSRIDRTRFAPVLITLFEFGGGEEQYLYGALPADVPVYRLSFKSFRDISSWCELWRTLRVIDPDIVLSSLFFSNTVMRVYKPLFRYKVITVELSTYSLKTRLMCLVDRILAMLTTHIVAVSKLVAEFTATQEGIAPGKFKVIETGVDIDTIRREARATDSHAMRRELGFSELDRVIVNVGRMDSRKNLPLLIEGFALFVRTHLAYRLCLVGGGETLPQMQLLAKHFGVADHITFTGLRRDVPRFYAISEACISTSSVEGLSLVHIEALACGIPLVATPNASSAQLLKDGVNGLLLEATPAGVASGLSRLDTLDTATRRAMEEAARRSVDAYSIDRMVASYENLLADSLPPVV